MFVHNNDYPSPGSTGHDDEQIDGSLNSPRHLNMTIRILNDSIFSVKISNEIKLETIHKGFLSTINRRKELFEQIQHLNKQCQILYEKNQLIKENNRNQLTFNEDLERNYRQQIQNEIDQQNQWKIKIDSI